MGLVRFVTTTGAGYSGITSKDKDTLYFISDERRIYKGEVPYSGGIFTTVAEFPETGEVNTLYVNSATGEVRYYNGTSYQTVVPATGKSITGKGDGSLATTAAVAAYVTSQIGDLNISALKGRVDTLEGEMDTAQGQITTINGEGDGSIKKAASDAVASAKNYTDTVAASKANTAHTHAIADVTGLQTALNGKADKATTLAGYGIEDAYTKNEIPFITLSQLGAIPGSDVSDILLDAINNYSDRIIVIDHVYRCYKDITISVSNWHIYALPATKIITDHTLTISNCANIKIDNLVWRDETNSSEQIGLILESTVTNSIFNRCTIRGFKTACVLNDLAYVVFNDCDFVSGTNSETLVRINNFYSELSKFNRCKFEGGFTEQQHCETGIEIQAGVWFEFNSCDITNCDTLLFIHDLQANTRQLRFTNCTFDHYIYGIVWGHRGITSLLFSQCIFTGNGGKYNNPLYLLKDVRGDVTFKDCFETTEADNYCFVKVAEEYFNTTIMGNFLEAKKFYDATTENVKNNSNATMNIELTNPDVRSMAKESTADYTQINSVGFFIPKLLWSDNNNAYKVIPYGEKPLDSTYRIYFDINKDGNAYTYVYQLCRLW